MLTNFRTIQSRIARLKEIETMSEDGTFDVLPKKEVIALKKEWDKLEKNLGGIKDMKRIPDAIFIVDPKKERICVQEAQSLGITLIGIADTNCDPDELDYVILRIVIVMQFGAVKLIVSKYILFITMNWLKRNKMLEDLFSLIRIPSISAKPEHHDDMLACAERWAQLLIEAGADEALVMPSKGNPIVFGQKTVDPTAKTVLIYAHYDVMPAEPLELWKSEPFEPEIRDEHIWARGADDDKGQAFIQVKACLLSSSAPRARMCSFT